MTREKMVKTGKKALVVVSIIGAFLLGGFMNSAMRTKEESFGSLVTYRDGNTIVQRVMNYDAWKDNTIADFAVNMGFQEKDAQ